MKVPFDHRSRPEDASLLPADRPTANGSISTDTQVFLQPQEQLRNAPLLTARSLIKECALRSMAASVELLLEAREHLRICRSEKAYKNTSNQVGDVVHLPNRGTAYFFTDLEGRYNIVVSVFENQKIIERWLKNDPDDQVFVCILGDSINRGATGSLLMEFFLDLKCRRGFSRQIIILPGNHELCPELQRQKNGLFDEIMLGRESYRRCNNQNDPLITAAVSVVDEPQFYLQKPQQPPQTLEATLKQARYGIWFLFTDIFHSLPKSILSSHGMYAAHAGFPTRGAFAHLFGKHPLEKQISNGQSPERESSLQPLRCISNVSPGCYPRYRLKPSEDLTNDMTWSDLDPKLDLLNDSPLLSLNTRGAADSAGHGIAFGQRAFTKFADWVGASVFLRGHQEIFTMPKKISSFREDHWKYGNIVTFTSRKLGAYAQVDLSTTRLGPDDIVVSSAPLDDE